MNPVIEQTVFYENTTPEELFDFFVNGKKHSEILGEADVKITPVEGEKFYQPEWPSYRQESDDRSGPDDRSTLAWGRLEKK